MEVVVGWMIMYVHSELVEWNLVFVTDSFLQ